MLKKIMTDASVPEDVQQAFKKALRKYGRRKDVVGVDVGWRHTKGEFDEDQLCVRIHVREKFDLDLLNKRERIPDEIDGVPTDVIEAPWLPSQGGSFQFNPERVKPQTTVQPGLSVGVKGGDSGTLGMLAVDSTTGASCWVVSDHVLHPHGDGGDGLLLQPGPSDAFPDARFLIGRASRRHRALGVALADAESIRPVDATLFAGPGPIVGTRSPRIGETLTKGGRTTDVTQGVVHGIGWFFQTSAGFTLVTVGGGVAEEISAGGDSGAIWCDDDMVGVGMQNWGEPDGMPDTEWALATDLSAAAAGLGFSLQ